MNKQQLASKIWESANKMRSKIDANEYKDYILGFIFYKFLSDKEEKYFKEQGLTDLKELKETNEEYKKYAQKNIGYFISYNDLFSTWLSKGKDFDVSNVRDALARFERLIDKSHEKVFSGIFETLQTGLSKLGDTTKNQTKAISDLLDLIKEIPMDGKTDYDVLGFIYEYLISNFAANAGKKAGEFYTPHEVSVLMSEIIANHLKDRKEISIYDPTSGSGSLLINIGKSASKYIKGDNKIKYYAQELKQNTYNLTRMNLVMRGILPSNITVRNGDTLATDWPYFDDSDPEGTYNPLYIDAVVSNPPYSQEWNRDDMGNDARFKDYGLAPKKKADYAFLLHDLFHLKQDGIMTIVLPHGVLFRGGEEAEIRKNLIEKNRIDAIIGLPANIFFGTGIPTIIMVLKKERTNTDVQIIDASKGFEKVGKNNKLRACDVKKIVDAVIERKDVEKFSRVVTRDEIRENDYNLNIPRYVDSSEDAETYDIYATMFGGIPKSELEKLNPYFDEFPGLKEDIFKASNDEYYAIEKENLEEFIKNHKSVADFRVKYKQSIAYLPDYLKEELVKNALSVDIEAEENIISKRLFDTLDGFKLIDNYTAYQILDNKYTEISGNLELIQKEGLECVRIVDPNIVTKKKDGKDTEVQEGWKGHIIPFEVVQNSILPEIVKELSEERAKLEEAEAKRTEILDSLTEDEKEELGSCLNDDNTDFANAEIKKVAKEIRKSKDVTEDDPVNAIILQIDEAIEKIKNYKKTIKTAELNLVNATIKATEELTDEQIKELLFQHWVKPIIDEVELLDDKLISELIEKIEYLSNKYQDTLVDISENITKSEKELASKLTELTGSEFDMKGVEEFKKLLGR